MPEDRTGEDTGIASLFRARDYRRFFAAGFVSSLGDWVGIAATTALAYKITNGSKSAVGLMLLARVVPGFFLAPLLGALSDRFDRRKTMVLCDIGRGLVLASMPFIDTLVGLFVASLFLEFLTLLWTPAKEATVPNLVSPAQLTTANSLSLLAAYGTLPIAGLVYFAITSLAQRLASFSVFNEFASKEENLAFLVDAATFMISASIVFRLDLHAKEAARKARREARHGDDQPSAMHEVIEGIRYIGRHPMVRAVIMGMGTALLGAGAVFALGISFATETLRAENGYGVLQTALGVGAGLGMFLLGIVGQKLPRDVVFAFSLLFAGGALFIASLMVSFVAALAFVVLLGSFAGAAYVTGFSLLHEEVRDDVRGRTFATLYTVVRFCLMVSLAGAPFVSEALDSVFTFASDGPLSVLADGTRVTLALGGIVVALSGALTLTAVRKHRAGAHYVTAEFTRPEEAALGLGFHTGQVGAAEVEAVRADAVARATAEAYSVAPMLPGPAAAPKRPGTPPAPPPSRPAIPATEYLDIQAGFTPPPEDELASRRRRRRTSGGAGGGA